jgi:TPR repeat protein
MSKREVVFRGRGATIDCRRHCLAYLYRAGLGGVKNPKEAVSHLRTAAQRNNVLAMRMLAEIYQSGKVDRAEVAFGYLRAAIASDQHARKVVVKMKQSMMLDPQKVEAFLQSKLSP